MNKIILVEKVSVQSGGKIGYTLWDRNLSFTAISRKTGWFYAKGFLEGKSMVSLGDLFYG